MEKSSRSERVAGFLTQMKKIAFIADVRYQSNKNREGGNDGALTVIDKKRQRRSFLMQIKPSYLDHATTNAAIASARIAQKETGSPTMIFARYIPQPTAHRLLEAGIHFFDLAGNLHIDLGDFSQTVIGRPQSPQASEERPMTAARLQVMFLFISQPEAVSLPVRDISRLAGVSKSKAAQVRQEFLETGLVSKRGTTYRFHLARDAEGSLLTGYAKVLRPKLLIGRFQAPERTSEDFLKRLRKVTQTTDVKVALTGGPAADLLHPFYRGTEAPLFVSASGPDIRQALQILPDRNGPIILLRAFGELAFWKSISEWTVAPPWLVYAELMQASDPRAHEAAEELRREYLDQ